MARPGLTKNVKFKALVARLGLPRPYVVGLLEALWEWAHESGNPALGCAQNVEIAAEWPGERGILFEALRDGRWIEELENGEWQIHDYFDHAPRYVKERRRKELRRKKDAPKTGRKKAQPLRHDSDMGRSPPPSRSPLPTPAPAPAPHASLPAPPATPRARDELFDAVAEVGAADPKLNGSVIGKVCAALRAAEPPYTADEVRALPSALAAHRLDFTLTPTAIEKHISRVRVPPKAQPPPNGPAARGGFGGIDGLGEKLRRAECGELG